MKRIVKFVLLNLFLTTSLIAQDDEYGIASYYSDLFHGKPTASGELYNKNELTAAHKTLPFGTLVTVTHLGNKKSVRVRINDRGPFISGRVIELSRAAAQQLGLISEGAARVKVSISKEATPPAIATTQPPAKRPEAMETEVEKVKKETAKPAKKEEKVAAKETIAPKINQKPGGKTTAKSIEAPATVGTSVLIRGTQEFKPYDLYEVELKRPEKKGFGVQVSALSSQEALFRKIAELQGEWFENILISVEKDKDGVLYKIILGPYATRAEAAVYQKNLKKKKKIKGFVVDLSALTKE